MNCADTNWLEAIFLESARVEKRSRRATVDRILRRQVGVIGLSPIVYLEAEPAEWRQRQAELNGRFYLDPMNWDCLPR